MKAWNETRERYMLVKRRQNLGETGRGSFQKEERLDEFLGNKGAFYNVNESDNNDESYNENNGQEQLPEGFANSCYKIAKPVLLQKLINMFPSASTRSTIAECSYLLKMQAAVLEIDFDICEVIIGIAS